MDKRILAFSIAALVGGGAWAAGGHEAGQQGAAQVGFQELDGDQDGYISREEAEKLETLAENWETADQNADGMLDQAEFAAFEPGSDMEGDVSEPVLEETDDRPYTPGGEPAEELGTPTLEE